jgi:peptidoglycan/xylan/chitin deacetylase (PgdA/CDA1 family)
MSRRRMHEPERGGDAPVEARTSLARRIRARAASAVPVVPTVRLDRGPLCSFTFDDGATSALRNAGGRLEEAGGAGTFFVSAGLVADTERQDPHIWDERIRRALDAGHEIGCHTCRHPRVPAITTEDFVGELDDNLAAIRELLPGFRFASFSYPYGEATVAAKRIVASRFAVGRGLRRGLNGRVVDLSELRANKIESRTFDIDAYRDLIQRAVSRNAWLVFYTHDVTRHPSPWGCTPSDFGLVLELVVDAGMPVLPLKAALGRVAHRAPPDGD